ncbi:hypothetical protein ACFXON_24770, partial [Bacillus subtilis]
PTGGNTAVPPSDPTKPGAPGAKSEPTTPRPAAPRGPDPRQAWSRGEDPSTPRAENDPKATSTPEERTTQVVVREKQTQTTPDPVQEAKTETAPVQGHEGTTETAPVQQEATQNAPVPLHEATTQTMPVAVHEGDRVIDPVAASPALAVVAQHLSEHQVLSTGRPRGMEEGAYAVRLADALGLREALSHQRDPLGALQRLAETARENGHFGDPDHNRPPTPMSRDDLAGPQPHEGEHPQLAAGVPALTTPVRDLTLEPWSQGE